MGVEADQVDQVFLAGAFGGCVKRESALAIGLFPNVPADRIQLVGNAAGEGARIALASLEDAKRANELAHMAEYVDLSSRRDFQEEFINAVYFPV